MSELNFYYGAMKCGKTTKLITQLTNVRWNTNDSNEILCFAYKSSTISSKLNFTIENCLEFDEETNFSIIPKYQKVKYIFIDECQFLVKKQVLELIDLVDNCNINISCFGLRTNFKGEPFEGSIYLMAWATNLEEIEMKDSFGNKIAFQIRMQNDVRLTDGPSIQIGQHYKPVSRKEFKLNKYLPK